MRGLDRWLWLRDLLADSLDSAWRRVAPLLLYLLLVVSFVALVALALDLIGGYSVLAFPR